MVKWLIRAAMDEIDIVRRYAGHPTIFSILVFHGGEFTSFPEREYIKGKKTYVDLLDSNTFSIDDIDDMMLELGYVVDGIPLLYHYRRPQSDLDFGLFTLGSHQDIRDLVSYVSKHKLIEVYIEHGKTFLRTYEMPPTQSKIRIEEIIEPPECSRRLSLGWNGDDTEEDNGNKGADIGDDIGEGKGHSDEGSDSDDSDYIVDKDNMVEDVDVDMSDFHLNIDKDAEWVGGNNNIVVEENNTEPEVEVEVLDNETLLPESSSDEGPTNQRKKAIKALRIAHENDQALVADPFYIHQTFSSATEFKEKVKRHSIDTRRELEFEKNDKNRVRVVCKGEIPSLENIEFGGSSSKSVNNEEETKCPWLLLASKWKRDIDWTVKKYNNQHRCLQTREVKACNYLFLSKQIVDQVESNPTIPIRALRDQLQRKYQVSISGMKVFRAKHEATKLLRGDYASQYALLRDYILELQTRNPDTTVKVDVETEPNYNLETRTFRRIYICLGPLKKGFVAGKRELLGLDGAFMKGPYPGQLLSAVGLDGNNGTYSVAYAMVESENTNSWTWFLNCLGDNLGLHRNSNFTFISDRQKGVIPAIAGLFPSAEHRFCLRHIHQNMKVSWKGKAFKDLLWRCATTSTIQQFQGAMEDVKKTNNDLYEWLKKIPPQHWSRSHFSGRAHSDVLLNNMCEAFNSKLIDARDKPIIACLEFIREYLMKKIVNVQKTIEKASGPLTPTAAQWLEKLKTKATELRVVFCGNGKYQVTGQWLNQCIVDMAKQTCSCKHAIAAIWEMRNNKEDVRIPESWVHPAYWLKTWKEMYSFTIEPINGRNMWEKFECPTTLLPPKHHVPVGRPKKKRKKSAMELEDLVSGHTASRSNKSVTCSKCNNIGHNARSCKGQRAGGSQSSTRGRGAGTM